MHKTQYGWVYSPAEEKRVSEAEQSEAAMLRAAKHVRNCCLAGHTCGKGDSCRRKCSSCHQDIMAAWDGQKRELSKQADRFLNQHDGIPLIAMKVPALPREEDVVAAVLEALRQMGITF